MTPSKDLEEVGGLFCQAQHFDLLFGQLRIQECLVPWRSVVALALAGNTGYSRDRFPMAPFGIQSRTPT